MSTEAMHPSGAPRPSRWIFVPPPPLFVAAFLAGLQLTRALPWALVPVTIHPLARVLGLALVAGSVLLIAVAPVLFLLRRTTIIPHAKAQALVTAGPYRLTRNPMYLGLTTAYLGIALVLNLGWPLLFLTFPLWVLQTRVIPFEEKNLGEAFGEEYRAYQRLVRRWI